MSSHHYICVWGQWYHRLYSPLRARACARVCACEVAEVIFVKWRDSPVAHSRAAAICVGSWFQTSIALTLATTQIKLNQQTLIKLTYTDLIRNMERNVTWQVRRNRKIQKIHRHQDDHGSMVWQHLVRQRLVQQRLFRGTHLPTLLGRFLL